MHVEVVIKNMCSLPNRIKETGAANPVWCGAHGEGRSRASLPLAPSVTLEKRVAALVWLRLQRRDTSGVPNHQSAWRRLFDELRERRRMKAPRNSNARLRQLAISS